MHASTHTHTHTHTHTQGELAVGDPKPPRFTHCLSTLKIRNVAKNPIRNVAKNPIRNVVIFVQI
jgi:hypothetical protein